VVLFDIFGTWFPISVFSNCVPKTHILLVSIPWPWTPR